MKKLALALAVVGAVVFAGSDVSAQGRGGGGSGGGGSRGGAPGGGGQGGGGSGWQGGGGHGGGGSGWQGGGGYHGGGWYGGGGYRGGGWYGGGYRGGWYGPNVGVYFGGPAYWGWGWGGWPYAYAESYPVYSGYPSYYYLPSEPTAFVQAAPDPAANAANYWYYCTDPAGYFPYVQKCSKAWMQVVPQNVPTAPNARAPQ